MKSILFSLAFALTLFSCSKQNESPKTSIQNYQYRLATIDLDSFVSYSSVASVRTTSVQTNSQDQTISVQTTEVNDDNHGGSSKGCKGHEDDDEEECKAMPIVLEYFKAYSEDQQNVYITWKTDVEYNVNRFEIQRSKDGKNFKTVAIVWPNNTPSTYKIKDTYKKD